MRTMVVAGAAAVLLAAAPVPGPTRDPVLESYAATAVGRFDTRAQHDADPRYDIAEAVVARIWADAGDGVWVYQEQAILNRAGMTEDAARVAPYFQRIGHIVRDADGRLRRDNYTIDQPARFVGLGRPGYAGPQPTRADLGAAGCANAITMVAAGHFTATTNGCANAYRGAVSMLSLAISTPDTYANWDRGFDAAGNRVWGPADGGYLFRRR